MPPKPIVSRNDILIASIFLIRNKGIENVNARSIAKALNCSTKPLFRVYENMAELKEDVYGKATEYYESFLFRKRAGEEDAFLSMGLNYVRFAVAEKELFKFIFLSNNLKIKSLDELAGPQNARKMIEHLVASTGLQNKRAKELFAELWLLVHGIATILATNPCELDDSEIERLLNDAYTAKIQYLKE